MALQMRASHPYHLLPRPQHLALAAVTEQAHLQPSRVRSQASPPTQSTSTRRCYASQTSLGTTPSQQRPPHRKVTPFNDTGAVPWGQLSPAEKLARTTQQSVNLTVILAGGLATIAVFALLYTDVFSPSSRTVQFNHAVSKIRANSEVAEALGGRGKDIAAYGEASWNKWRRNRPIASKTETDSIGTERLHMHFNVEGTKNTGVARMLMMRRRDESQFSFGHLYVDVDGGKRIWVEKDDQRKKTPGRFFGVRWS